MVALLAGPPVPMTTRPPVVPMILRASTGILTTITAMVTRSIGIMTILSARLRRTLTDTEAIIPKESLHRAVIKRRLRERSTHQSTRLPPNTVPSETRVRVKQARTKEGQKKVRIVIARRGTIARSGARTRAVVAKATSTPAAASTAVDMVHQSRKATMVAAALVETSTERASTAIATDREEIRSVGMLVTSECQS